MRDLLAKCGNNCGRCTLHTGNLTDDTRQWCAYGMARYINQNLPGMNIGEETIIRIRQASDRPGECVKIAAETVDGLRPLCGGALLVTTGWEKRLPDILAALKM